MASNGEGCSVRQRATAGADRGMPPALSNMKINSDYDLKPLVLAVVTQAARDASRGDEQARLWLRDESFAWLDGAGVEIRPQLIQRWTRKGCKMPARAKKMQAQPAA